MTSYDFEVAAARSIATSQLWPQRRQEETLPAVSFAEPGRDRLNLLVQEAGLPLPGGLPDQNRRLYRTGPYVGWASAGSTLSIWTTPLRPTR